MSENDPGSGALELTANHGPRVAAFVSPHGFGHAARASAVLAEVHRLGAVGVELFTTAPRWFFEESISGLFRYHPFEVDVGFRQRSALEFDAGATVSALRAFVPFDPALVSQLAATVREAGCEVVLCDIAPLGVAVAEAAGLPSVLVENFDWPWLYEPLLEQEPELELLSAALEEWTRRATAHVQARPVCVRHSAHELVDPIAREPRLSRAQARAELGVDDDRPIVVVTMGGYGEDLPFLPRLSALSDVVFVVTGSPGTSVEGSLRLFDNNTPLFMPDVLRASDAVVAKLGYGTVSEVWRDGLPYAHVTRPNFREMASLERFAAEELSGFLLSGDDFIAGAWIERIPELLDMPRMPHPGGGATRAAEIVLGGL